MFSLPATLGSVVLFLALIPFASAQQPNVPRSIPLPTSKTLTVPSPGRIGNTNSFPATIVLSPDGRYAALLNDGYGTQETLAHQSIAVLDLKNNSSRRLSRRAAERRVVPELFSGAGFQFGRQAPVRFGGIGD